MSSETVTADESLQPVDSALRTDAMPDALRTSAAARAAAYWRRIESLLVYVGDWLNPILVKETRQALKSTQFTITFVLVLVACWVVTIGGVAMVGPSIFYAAAGGTLLLGYYAVLAFPLTVVVPYAAFRSLAAEREDNTYDLLSITTLKPWQIISGKLGSSVVQMAVYFSAITPCLAFTYLLRGVDVVTIVLLLAYSFFSSLGLSMVGILLATLSGQRFAQVFLSVAFVAFLLGSFLTAMNAGVAIVAFSYSIVGGDEFMITVTALATAYLTTFALTFFAAVGMITFASENRSTPLRLCMLVQQAAGLGWVAYGWIYNDYDVDVLLVATVLAGMYWYAMGTLVTAERPGMSQRIRRRLPTSFFGRMFLTWLNPGPGTGYMFAVANVTTIVILFLIAMVLGSWLRTAAAGQSYDEMFYMLVVGGGYLVAYLGVGFLVIRALRRITIVTMLAAVLIHFLVLLAGTGIPTVLQFMSLELRDLEYSMLQVTNPFWSLSHLMDGGIATEGTLLILIVPAAALCILLLNLGAIIREVQSVRIAPPPRVLEDEAELHPAPETLPQNPWDEPE